MCVTEFVSVSLSGMQEVLVIAILVCQLLLQGSLASKTGDVRLVNAPNGTMCEGRLDLYINEQFVRGWFSICDDSFDAGEMQVVCRQLGCHYNNGYRTNILKYGALPQDTIEYQLECTGSEKDLLQCSDSGVNTCLSTHAEHYIGVVCNGEVKLSGWNVPLAAVLLCAVLQLLS